VSISPAVLAAAGAVAALVTLALGFVWWRRRRRTLDRLIRRIAWDRLDDVVIPDDVDGELHLDLVLLTLRGILVMEVRRVAGTLFWGDQLEQWTVLDGARRTVLRNPLPGLQARRHAVQAIVPDAPVGGCVLLVGSVRISGGAPPGVMLPEELAAQVPARGRQRPDAALKAAWGALKANARPAAA
jgi:hypothetical protein